MVLADVLAAPVIESFDFTGDRGCFDLMSEMGQREGGAMLRQYDPATLARKLGLLIGIAGLVFCSPRMGAQSSPPSVDDYLNQAQAMEKSDNYAGAEKVYREALLRYPGQLEILKRLGTIYQTELKFQDSIPSRPYWQRSRSTRR